jgi:hypothetical protein
MIEFSFNSSEWPEKKDLEELAEGQLKQYIGVIFRTAVKLSPVYSGAFRASWRVAFNEPREDVTPGRDPSTPTRGAAFRWPDGFKLGYTVYVSNNQPYAELIEYGGLSKQAPSGVLRLAVATAELST